MKEYGDNNNKDITTTAIATTSSSGFFLGLIRISDPVVWKKIKGLTNHTKQENQTTEDAWTQPISVFVQGKLNAELTRCIFESLQFVYINAKAREWEDIEINNDAFTKKETFKIFDNKNSMAIWGVRDSKINGIMIDVYALDIFLAILKQNDITLDEILNSVDPLNNSNTSVDQSSGKSGSFFLVTKDQRLSIKTIKKNERKIMRKFLKDYYQHLQENQSSFLCKIYGLFILRIPGVANINILLMQNVFYMVNYKEIYDIKGSTKGRILKEKERDSRPFKDLDFLNKKDKFKLHSEDIKNIKTQLLRDLNLLKRHKLMDYSMLISISSSKDNTIIMKNSYKSLRGSKIYTFGIIDFLTEYGYLKSLEVAFKEIWYGKNAYRVSVANPNRYATRLFNFFFSFVIQVNRKTPSFVIKDN